MQQMTSGDAQDQTNVIPENQVASGSQVHREHTARPDPLEQKKELFYTQEQDSDLNSNSPIHQHNQADHSMPFILPFQHSGGLPTATHIDASNVYPGQSSTPSVSGKTQRRSLRLVKILLIVCVVLVTVIGASVFVLAQPAPATPPPSSGQEKGEQTPRKTGEASTIAPHQNTPTPQKAAQPRPTPKPTTTTADPGQNTQNPGTQNGNNGSVQPTTEWLDQLGWTQAGLSQSDAFEALRTATSFTDREMSYDYRNIGTVTHHGGTLTSATFLLTPGGRVRFMQNDRRVMNNDFYNEIRMKKKIQQVVHIQPTLVQVRVVQLQGKQHIFSWVDVSFELFQSQIDLTTGKHTDGPERDTTTGLSAIHHLIVILVRVPPQSQGVNAPMGGTGWLVNMYALDAKQRPEPATIPSL